MLAPNIDVFGEPATFSPAVGASFDFMGIFDNAYKEISMSDFGTEITSVYPVIGINLADFPNVPLQGDSLTIQGTGKTYIVRDVQPDSHGGAMLILNYVSG